MLRAGRATASSGLVSAAADVPQQFQSGISSISNPILSATYSVDRVNDTPVVFAEQPGKYEYFIMLRFTTLLRIGVAFGIGGQRTVYKCGHLGATFDVVHGHAHHAALEHACGISHVLHEVARLDVVSGR